MGTSISLKARAKNATTKVIRFLTNLKRPSRRTNLKLLQQRGETLDSFVIREATIEDLPALANLHVKTWQETYRVKRPPTYAIREYQWREQFKVTDGSWFCFVVENNKKELIGFLKGKRNEKNTGAIDKIYLLSTYQRLGLGRKLVGEAARRFLSIGINTIVLFGIPQNPSSYFHKAIGGEKLYADNGEFHGGYIWKDVQALAALH